MNSAELNTLDRALRALRLGKLATAHGSTFYFALPKRYEDEK
jgi:hypothetical protein